jgi:hypothetical protein
VSLFVRTGPPSLPALRRRLLGWSALLLCAGGCLNPQPDPFPQSNPAAPAADTAPAGSNDASNHPQPPPARATQAPPQSNLNGSPEAAAPPEPATPAAPGADLDAGAAPDAEAPDANPALSDDDR